MREKELEKIVSMICNGFVDTILVGVEEQQNKFPYLVACANFMYELKAKNIQVEFNTVFTDTISDKIFRETSNYLVD